MVDAAVALLVAGIDAPELRIVAGDDRADSRELRLDLDRALVAFGLQPISPQAAGIRLAIPIARDIVAGHASDVRIAAKELWALWLAADEPELLNDLAFTADGFVDAPTFVSVDALRDAASAFLDQTSTG